MVRIVLGVIILGFCLLMAIAWVFGAKSAGWRAQQLDPFVVIVVLPAVFGTSLIGQGASARAILDSRPSTPLRNGPRRVTFLPARR